MAGLNRPLAGRRIGLLTAFVGDRGGGVAEAVRAQAEMIAGLGATPVIFALDADPRCEALYETHRAAILGPAQVGYAPAQLGQLRAANLDLLHLHGIWMHPSRAGAQWAAQSGRPYVVSAHGMLDPWITARGRWKKALARRGYERASWRRASALHALTADEARDIAHETGRSETLVIPNPGPPARAAPPDPRPPRALFIGRIHPKKNLAALLAGWRLAALPEAARLDIAGWGDASDIAAFERELAQAGDPRIAFHGPAFGAAKAALLEGARFAVLPSFSEGLPMAILEAWAAGVPTLMSPHCHLPEGFVHGAALDSGTAPETVAAALQAALHCDEATWQAMSQAALALASGPFSIASVAGRWEDAYARLIAAPPVDGAA